LAGDLAAESCFSLTQHRVALYAPATPEKQDYPDTWRLAMAPGVKYPAELLTEDEARALIRSCSRRAPTGVRNAALFAVLYRSGLRIGEALALHVKDVDPAAGTVTVLHGKGDRRRVVSIGAGALALLERWIDRRHALGLNGRQPLFCTLKGEPLDDSYVRHAMRRAAARAGIEKRVHPHQLRHTHAAELMRKGVPANVIQADLGHSSLATTDVYLRHIAPEERINRLRELDDWEV
jgi:integrase/recombinase XerD